MHPDYEDYKISLDRQWQQWRLENLTFKQQVQDKMWLSRQLEAMR